MTALDRYVRLESEALWRAAADEQRRDVSISFGDATLVIADATGRPLAHWSLPALIRQNPDEVPAIYAPDEDASEILEIADTTMIEAIEEVRKALAKARPKPGKLRHWLTAGLIILSLALAIFWLPGALTRQTLAVVPTSKRSEIGVEMLGYLQIQTGAACKAPRADAAARRLAQRLFGPMTVTQIIVVPDLRQGALALPGDLIVLDYEVLQLSDDPAVAAGFILASHAALADVDPLESLLRQEGLGTTFRLLTTGEIPSEILQSNVAALAQNDVTTPDPGRLRRVLADAEIPQGPYLTTIDARTGTMPDLGTDPLAERSIPLILQDSDWVSLQNICNI
ncbi:hypothetical protein BC777_2956 [Yoonia maricola]|uniref:Uncharacterized protein n=1 Tax=Yoonia maricola TaxID=420999 RepID=A0A2M8W201_9RHOB|nr:hypothetical protein [Yoonia maricola]PJI84962.1 hypothetical protein BC777_2956 [Yoonia maricola]